VQASQESILSNKKSFIRTLYLQGARFVFRPPGTKSVVAGFDLKSAFEGKVLPSLEELECWDGDYAAVAGLNGLVGVDSDSAASRIKFWDCRLAQELPNDTVVVQTNRGFCDWFFDPSLNLEIMPTVIDCRPVLDVEIFFHHHLLAVPGNLHPSGSVYRLVGTSRVLVKRGIADVLIERVRSLGVSVGTNSSNMCSYPSALAAGILRLDAKFAEGVEKAIEKIWLKGQRYKIQLALAGWFLRLEIAPDQAIEFIMKLGQDLALMKDGEHWDPKRQARELQSAYSSAAKGSKLYGLSTLLQLAEAQNRPEVAKKLLLLNEKFKRGRF
jgi:hypothetical protein